MSQHCKCVLYKLEALIQTQTQTLANEVVTLLLLLYNDYFFYCFCVY